MTVIQNWLTDYVNSWRKILENKSKMRKRRSAHFPGKSEKIFESTDGYGGTITYYILRVTEISLGEKSHV